MNHNWKDRILRHEETVPETAWSNIAQLMDDEKLQNQLLSAEVFPPAEAWQCITTRLCDEPIRDKMLEANVAPPSRVWDVITKALDNEIKPGQVTIATDDENKKKIIPINAASTKRIFSVNSIAAAAVAFLIFVGAAFWINNTKKNEHPTSVASLSHSQIISQPTTMATTVKPQIQESFSAKKKVVTKNYTTELFIDTSVDLSLALTENTTALVQDPMLTFNEKLTTTDGNIVNDIAMVNTPNNYITITGPNGESVKVSPKFSKLINYLKDRDPSTEEYIDKVIKEGALWKGKFRVWRDKMSNTDVAPSSVNFLDIIGLSNTIKDN